MQSGTYFILIDDYVNNKIYKITNKSGHFCPKAEKNILKFLIVLKDFFPKAVILIYCFYKNIIKYN